jgi:hypothetical protein
MVTIFFSDVSLITMDALPSHARFTQEYFVNDILPDIVETRGRICREVRSGELFVHMDNPMCHNRRKVTDELANLKLDRVPRPLYSPDLSPCNFWLFGMLNHKIKDPVFQTVEDIMTAVHRVWDELTLDDLQSVFFNWIERFEWVSEHEENITQIDIHKLSESLSHGEIEGIGSSDFRLISAFVISLCGGNQK